ncbi:MAG: DUF697 domain-containing protein [Nostocales cyanobacterium]|nr:MAG: DUF697 domain-containing protein [Nostocales cyanobacterium]TAF12316.1 MAG: DUF697 domain-containing protein [Nostocales cyanobacterium]
MLNSWYDSIVQVGEFSLLSAVVVGGGLWLLNQNQAQADELLDDISVENALAKLNEGIAKTEVIIHQIIQEAVNHPQIKTLQDQLSQLHLELDRQEIQIAVTGSKSVGKSTVIQTLKNVEGLSKHSLHFVETSPLFAEIGENSDLVILSKLQTSDVVLFLTNGDLTNSEFQVWQKLKALKQPTLLVFNKQDQYIAEDRNIILQSLQQKTGGNVVATAVSPLPVKVKKHETDGTIQEWMEQPAPNIQELTQNLGQILSAQAQYLVCKTTLRKVLLLKAEAKNCLNQIRGDRSSPIIEQNQWIAAAAAFANPLPALDILATAAINAQMVVDLGNIYQQKISLEQAQQVAATMGSLMLKLGLVELSTKAVTGILKTNAITFVAGGVVEGVSAAYLTRIAGLSLVAYFEQQEIALETGNGLNLEKLRQVLQTVFQQNQRMAILETFVKQGVKRLLPDTKPVEVV